VRTRFDEVFVLRRLPLATFRRRVGVPPASRFRRVPAGRAVVRRRAPEAWTAVRGLVIVGNCRWPGRRFRGARGQVGDARRYRVRARVASVSLSQPEEPG